MKSGKNLGIAYSVKKKAKGGKVDHSGPERGVNRAVRAPSLKGGMSDAGLQARIAKETEGHPVSAESKEDAKSLHRKTIQESRSMPKPNLPMAEGGMIDKKAATAAQRGPKTIPLKHPSMQQSPVFRTKLRDQEDDLEMLADGGSIDPLGQAAGTEAAGMEDRGTIDSSGKYTNYSQQPSTSSEKEINPKNSKRYAKGGEISDIDGGAEESMDHEDSMADAIMARRDRLHEEIDSGAHDLDSAVRMAEGGEVDIDENAEEQPNEFYDLNEDAALKENYDSDMDDVSQPKDSNEHGHTLSDEDENDMVDKIRSGMKKRQR